MSEFRDVLGLCNLHDLGFVGMPWTYNNKQSGDKNVRVCLDRAVASPSWSDWFPDSSLRHIASSHSDHVTILLELEKDNMHNRVTRILRYEIMWERDDSLPSEIKQAWEAFGRTVQHPGDVTGTLQKVMISLRRWSKEKFGTVMKEIANIKESLEVLTLQDPVANQAKLAELTKRMDKPLP
jgi:hypothetical protein